MHSTVSYSVLPKCTLHQAPVLALTYAQMLCLDKMQPCLHFTWCLFSDSAGHDGYGVGIAMHGRVRSVATQGAAGLLQAQVRGQGLELISKYALSFDGRIFF